MVKQTRQETCACGRTFEPSGRQKQCNICRFPPKRIYRKLTADQVREIRRRVMTGQESYEVIARDFHISRSNVGQIVNHETWRHVN